jgi:hypothetical protein
LKSTPVILIQIVFLEAKKHIRKRDEKESYKKPPFQGAGSYKRMRIAIDPSPAGGHRHTTVQGPASVPGYWSGWYISRFSSAASFCYKQNLAG